MDTQQILLRCEKEAAGAAHCESFSLASLFAHCLSMISERLTEDELEQFIRIGAGIYQCAVRENGKSVPVDDLLPASECWGRKIDGSLYQ